MHKPDMDELAHLIQAADESGVATEGDDPDNMFGASFLSNGSSEHVLQYGDESDSSTTNARTSAAITHLVNKIKRTKDCIRLEQTLRDGKYYHCFQDPRLPEVPF